LLNGGASDERVKERAKAARRGVRLHWFTVRFFAGCAACGEAALEAAIVAHWHGDVRSVARAK